MKALSIRQPWAWLIIHGGKDIENRSWHTKLRGRFLVHASKGMTRAEYAEAHYFAVQGGMLEHPFILPSFEDLQRGGIIGSVELVDSVDTSDSPWYMGQKAFVLRDPQPLAFVPIKGRLQFFEVRADLLTTDRRTAD
ncbi:ASCH domain-containing protein [Pseudomonas extremaustralis]